MDDDWKARCDALEAGGYPPGRAAYDGNPIVRAMAAGMPLPARMLRRLADDPDANVRLALARRPDLDAGLADDLSWDAEPMVRAAIAGRGDLDERVRARLSDDMDPLVLDALGLHDRATLARRLHPIRTEPKKVGLWR